MPLAKAAETALVNTEEPTTWACGVPPCISAYFMANRPGSRVVTETIAPMVSRIWCLVFSATSAGTGAVRDSTMYSLNIPMMLSSEDCWPAIC